MSWTSWLKIPLQLQTRCAKASVTHIFLYLRGPFPLSCTPETSMPSAGLTCQLWPDVLTFG